jgi:hypothetical protein
MLVARWVSLVSLAACVGCYGATDGSNDPDGQGGAAAASSGASSGTDADGGGTVFGGSSSTGSGGSRATGSGGAVTTGGSTATAGTSSTGGATTVSDMCTDLELVPMAVTCETIATAPAAVGGVIPDGTYALADMQMIGDTASCSFTFNYTIRINGLGLNNYTIELVLDLVELEGSGTFTTNGTSMTTTISCVSDGSGASNEPATTSYSAYTDLDGTRFVLIDEAIVYTFVKVGVN